MQTTRHKLATEDAPAALVAGTAACIGAFDGLHRGHQALLRRARAMAARVALVTFDPHPSAVLAPHRAPPLLQTAAQRERVCRQLGIDDLVLLPFSLEIAALSPSEFLRRFITAGLQPHAVVVGEDFRFGKGRAGGLPELRAACEANSAPFEAIGEVKSGDGERISSSRIRTLVREGAVARASEMLDRWYTVEGSVRHGAARGRTLGFPTANVASQNAVVPASGVYASVLVITDPASDLCGQRFAAATNIGQNPTFEDGAETTTGIEVHAIDVDLGDALYDVQVEVGFVKRLRDEEKFPDAEALKRAIASDLERARPILSDDVIQRVPAPVHGGDRA